jgi:hypothetical protein
MDRTQALITVGIDPGVKTGFATASGGKLLRVESMRIDQAMAEVAALHNAGALRMVVYEDARRRGGAGKRSAKRAQGAGSIKRDCRIWADYLAAIGCPVLSLAPQRGLTKWKTKDFAASTGWARRTNEHGRDAALLINGRKL